MFVLILVLRFRLSAVAVPDGMIIALVDPATTPNLAYVVASNTFEFDTTLSGIELVVLSERLLFGSFGNGTMIPVNDAVFHAKV